MTEVERIKNNNNLEIPIEPYDVLRVKRISNPASELEIFKNTIIVFLENQDLDEEDKQWESLLPKSIVAFTDQLTDEDYHKDDLISHIPSMIDNLKEIRDWEWYSSKLTDDGFEVIMSGIFRGIFLPMLHHQGIPHKSLFIERDGIEYPTKALTDVLTYKTWNPETLELK